MEKMRFVSSFYFFKGKESKYLLLTAICGIPGKFSGVTTLTRPLSLMLRTPVRHMLKLLILYSIVLNFGPHFPPPDRFKYT
jgi:hypothetical protein